MPDKRVTDPQTGKRLIVRIGQQFGRLIVVEELQPQQRLKNGRKIGFRRFFQCVCKCGAMVSVELSHLRCGHSASCKCLQAEVTHKRNYRHGMTDTPEYETWATMIKRCGNPVGKNACYKDVSVCAEWMHDFQAFYEHVGPRPTPSHSIDRINPFGDYRPGNVRWATPVEQQQNKRARYALAR